MNAASLPSAAAPPDADGVAAVLRDCASDGRAVVAEGGGTLVAIGNAPQRCDLVLQLRRLDAIAAYDPADLTIGVGAGLTLAQLGRTLAAAGQWLPLDAPAPERATVGGTLAAGWTGPRRARYGRPRDLLIGSTVALADGTLARAGGMVVKNVTGYDMSKLYVGALGTLGIFTRANFKTLPLPAARRLALAPLDDDLRERAEHALASLRFEPTAALALDGFTRGAPAGAPMHLAVLYEGAESVVERGIRDLRSAFGKTGIAQTLVADGDDAEQRFAAVVEAYVAVIGERSITYRDAGPSSSAFGRARAVRRAAAAAGVAVETIVDYVCGDVIVRCSAPSARVLEAAIGAADRAVRAALPRAWVVAGAARARALVDAWGAPPTTLGTMRAVKARFDPRGTLAPGRYLGGI